MSKLTDEELVDELFKLKESWAHEDQDKFLKLYPKPMKHILDAMFREHSEAKQELNRWKAVALYLTDCHAANTEGGTPKRLNKNDQERFKTILEKAIGFIEGDWPNHRHIVADPQKVLDRCREDLKRMKSE
jgi:hypothetical protein